jgi:RES domain
VARTPGLHDRDLLDALESLEPEPFSGTAWRTTWTTRDPLIGSTAGGRWHPENSFEALYTSTESDGSLAEVYFHLSRAPVFSSAQVRLHRLRVETRRTLRLDLEMLGGLGVEAARYAAMDYARTREIGAAAHFLEFDSLLVPSPRWPCLNLVLFLDRLDPDSSAVEEMRDVNWPAWREKNKRS